MKQHSNSATSQNAYMSAADAADSAQYEPTTSDTNLHLLVGSDWADGEHVYEMLDPHGQRNRGTVEQTPAAIVDELWNLIANRERYLNN